MSPASPRSERERSRLTDAYAAGLIDGEGCLYVGPNLRPVAQIGMAVKARPTLERLQREYGGRMRTAWKGNERWSEEARWTIQGAELVAMLQRVTPFLDLKAEQARLCLKAAEIHDALPKIGRKRWTPEARERVGTIRERIMELNRRGPQIKTQVREGAIALLVAGQWVSPQTDLFSDLGFTPFSGPWPRSAMSRDGIVYELPTWARLTDETAGSASRPSHLLPTPSAEESTPTDEHVEELREHLDPDDPHHRLWLPGRKWMAQRTLSRTIPALLPTPRTNEGTGPFPHERPEDMDNLATRISRLLPTPAASDAGGRKAGWEGRQGGPDLGAVVEDDIALLPTPSAWLGRRPENSTADPERMASREHEGTRGKRSLELPEALALAGVTEKLLPTPTAMDAAGARNSTANRREDSTGHSGDTLTDAVWKTVGAPDEDLVRGGTAPVRLLPTPQAADGDGGRQERGAMGAGGVRPSGHKATLPLPTAVAMRETISETPFSHVAEGEQMELLPTPTGYAGDRIDGQLGAEIAMLPTPVANPENPGAGGELRAAMIIHGEGRRNETGVDTLGRPNRGRAGTPSDDVDLLPTPTAFGAANTSEQGPRYYAGGGDNPTLLGAARRVTGTSRPHGDRLLPTPTTQDGENTAGPSQHERNSDPLNVAATKVSVSWGVYEAAVRRWEDVLGRDAPPPTDEKGRLAPEFVEWMLGYDEGWFDLDGLKRTAKLRALGNSVQVQCAEAVGLWARDLIRSGTLG